jgi:hypothetical protein
MEERKKKKRVEYLKRKHLPESELKKKLKKEAPEETGQEDSAQEE